VDVALSGCRPTARLPRGRIDVMPLAFGEEDGAAARVLLPSDCLPTAVIGCGDDHCGAGLVPPSPAPAPPSRTPSRSLATTTATSHLSYNGLTAVRQDVGLTVDANLPAILRRLTDPTSAPQAPDRGDAHQRSTTGPPRGSKEGFSRARDHEMRSAGEQARAKRRADRPA